MPMGHCWLYPPNSVKKCPWGTTGCPRCEFMRLTRAGSRDRRQRGARTTTPIVLRHEEATGPKSAAEQTPRGPFSGSRNAPQLGSPGIWPPELHTSGLSSFSSSMDRNRKNSLRKSDSLRQTRAHLYPLTLTPGQLWTQTSHWVPFQVKSRFTESKILLKKSVLQEEQVSFEKRLSSVRSHFFPSVNSPHVAVLEPRTAARWGGSKQVKRSQDQRGGGGGSAAFRKSTVGGEVTLAGRGSGLWACRREGVDRGLGVPLGMGCSWGGECSGERVDPGCRGDAGGAWIGVWGCR